MDQKSAKTAKGMKSAPPNSPNIQECPFLATHRRLSLHWIQICFPRGLGTQSGLLGIKMSSKKIILIFAYIFFY